MVSDAFWDGINYAHGRNPVPPGALKPSPPLSADVRDRRWETLEAIFAYLGKRSGVENVVPQRLHSRYGRAAEVVGRGELVRMAMTLVSREWDVLPDYLLVDDRVYSSAEAFDLLRQALTAHRRTGSLPPTVSTDIHLGPTDGPLEPPPGDPTVALDWVVREADHLDEDVVPTVVGEGLLSSQFLFLMADAVVALYERRRLGSAPVPPTANASAVARRFHGEWPEGLRRWVIHDPGMNLDQLARLATLQFWTWKPVGFPW